VPDTDIASYAAGWSPASGVTYPATSTDAVSSLYLTVNVVRIAARLPGRSIATGDVVVFTATYPLG
jgi:galactitol-specific phosphotransferase system IIC component